MRPLFSLGCLPLVLSLFAVDVASAEDADTKTEPKKVTLKALELTVPEGWTQEQPASSLRLGQFSVKPSEGDGEAGELSIFTFGGGGGTVQANVQRWIGQFAAEGRDVALKTGTGAQGPYFLVDVTGTFNKPIGPPIRRMTEAVDDYRMLAIILNIKDKGTYYLKLVGPKKTIGDHADEFREMIGADPKKEQEFDPNAES